MRATLLIILTSHVTPELVTVALNVARDVRNPLQRAEILTTLAAHCTDSITRRLVVSDALTSVLSIADSNQRTRLLVALASHLTPELARQALSAVRGTWNPQQRAEILIALAPRFSHRSEQRTVLADALTTMQSIADSEQQTRLLVALAPQLTLELARQALNTAQSVWNPQQRAEVLMALLPHLAEGAEPQTVLTDALKTIMSMWDLDQRARMLASLRDHLRNTFEREALWTAIRDLRDLYVRADRLAKMIPLMPESSEHARLVLLSILRETKEFRRHDILNLLAINNLIGPPTVGEVTIGEIGANVIEVCSGWHWL